MHAPNSNQLELMMNRTATLLIAAMTLFVLAGCADKNKGYSHGQRLERRDGDAPTLGSADLVAASDAVATKIANRADIRSLDHRTVIVMDTVTNRTSDPSADFQIYLARIRALLNESSASNVVVFVESRAKAEQIKAREGYPADASRRTLPQYALTATFYDLPQKSGKYYLLTFQLVDLGNDLVQWEGSYEVKL